MTANDLNIVLLQCSELTDIIESEYSRVYQVDSLKDLVRVLIEKPVDLILLSTQFDSFDKLEKIFKRYHVPFLFVGPVQPPRLLKEESFIKTLDDPTTLLETIKSYFSEISHFRVQRENAKLKFTMDKVIDFFNKVVHTTKVQFTTEVKGYFNRSFKMESCHWVEVKAQTSKLPPILKLKQELEKLKINQGSLISDLGEYSIELLQKKNYQIWKNGHGEYLVMLWVHQDEMVSQCIILNKIQIHSLVTFQALIEKLHSVLARRWDLCLQVGEALKQVYRDSLTNLYNQRFLTETLAKKIEEYRRYKTPFSVLFIDVDHFKRVNDSLGHLVGSGVLQELGKLLKGQIRNSDYAFRYGGDEFIILLSHTEGDDAVNVAERIRQAVESFPFKLQGVQVNITVSIGLAFYPKHADSADEIIRIADEAMYYGKNKSRNIVYKAS